MSELYTNYSDNQISVTVPESVPYADLSITVNGVPFSFGSELTVRLNQDTTKPGVFKYTLPYRAVPFEGELIATWDFVESGIDTSVSETYELVTQVVPIRKIMDDYEMSAADAERHETLARQIITSYTGQTFGKFSGPVTVVGGGGSKLLLPRRLISINSVSPSTSKVYNLSGSNFFVNSERVFRNNESYIINGVWGHNSVPAAVQTAAGIIIDTLVSDEPTYRDRYLNAIRSADWRLDYNSRAFDGTGNVTVDQLLDPFVVYRIAVI